MVFRSPGLRLFFAFLLAFHSSVSVWADSPGGVSSHLQFWIKADAGLNESGGDAVDQWDDQSGNSRNASQSTASNRPIFQSNTSTHAVNFNPVVNFDGSNDVLTTTFDVGVDQYDDVTIYSVHIPSTNVPGAPWGNDDGGWDRFIIDVGSINDAIATGTNGTPAERVEDVTGLLDAGVTLTTIQWDEDATNGSFGWVNGVVGATFTANQSGQTDSNFGVGWDGDDNNFDGSLAEVVIYTSTHSAQNRNRIESYLALKYGITLLSSDYVNASGTVIWDGDGDGVNASFHNDVAGIGQDDDSGLDQIKSKSQNTGAIVTMKSATSQNNGDFLIWGNNGENQATWVSTSSTSGYMYLGLTTSDRIEWRATETNSIGTVTIEVNESDLPTFEDPLYIVIDTDDDEDLTDETPQQMTNAGGGIWTYAHNFSNGATNTDGQEFTFVQETATPLNVCGSNLKLWLDADDPTTLHTDAACTSAAPTDGTDVRCWEDKSSNGDDVTEISGDCDETTSGTQTCGIPKYETNEFNGRPTLEFVRSEDDAMRHTLSSSWSGVYSIFIAFAQVGTPATFYSFFSNGTPSGSDHFQIDSFDDSGTQTFRGNGAGGTLVFEPFDNDLKLYSILALSGGTTSYADGVLKNSNTGTTGRIFEHYRINQNRQGNHRNNAKISEIILCDTALGDCDFSRMNKYLGDKYGRDFSGIDSQYDYTVNHGTDTAGIGFDTSGITCTPAVVYDNVGSSILSLRINSPYDTGHNLDTTNQDERLSVGHNDGSLTETTSQVPSPYTHRLNRVWRADQDDGTGSDGIQDVVVSFDLSATSIDTSNVIDFALLLDSDGNFSNATTHTAGVTITNDIIQFTGVDFTDGDYFTLATQGPDPAPGGITTNLSLWLKADKGVTGTTNVSAWNDQSGNSNNIAQNDSSDQPSKTDNAVNFNPAITFDGVDEYFDALIGFEPLVDDYSVFMVSQYQDKGGTAVPITTQVDGSSINKTFIAVLPSGSANMRVDHRQPAANSGGDSYTATHSFGQPLLLAVHRDSASRYDGYNNGAETANSSPSEPAIASGQADEFVVGRNTLGSVSAQYYYEGDILELAIYSTDRESDNGKIQSYLALKYGITLSQSGSGTDYVDADGTEIWDKDAAGASTYDNDIAGIGQDALSELDQRVSKSVNADAIVTIATINDFTSTNADSTRESLGSGNFLVWGNNNSSATWVTANSPNKYKRLGREWSVQETGTVGNVHISVEVNDSDFDVPKFKGNLFFVYDSDNDGSLKDETPSEMVDAGSGRWTISNIDFSNGMEFTFAARGRRRIIISK